MVEPDLTFVDQMVEQLARQAAGRQGQASLRGELVPILQAIQGRYGYLPDEALRRVCQITDITASQVAGVSTFYSGFRLRPIGRHRIRVCVGTACHVKGASAVLDEVRAHLKIPDGADTDPGGTFTVEKVACLGCCTLAPVVQIGDVVYGHLSKDTIARAVGEFLR
ncbi:MAG TPA: NAD(P)H-dependent oxidoreductase subunit E, partial [Phycisphaerae bacterium]|nr:NAD(P)H-dependent oxidoreductase subunit E [Phycisphaerae bacterium]